MKKEIIKTLNAYLLQNKDVLSNEGIKNIKEQIAYMKKDKIKILSAEAVYTGGGIYIFYGKLSDGTFFRTCDDWEWIEICNSDTSVDDADYEEFYDEYRVKTLNGKQYEKFWNTMLKKIIREDLGGNYAISELKERFIPIVEINIEKEIVNVDVLNKKELTNCRGRKFFVMEVKPEICFILDDKNNFIDSYCGEIDEDEDNLSFLNRIN